MTVQRILDKRPPCGSSYIAPDATIAEILQSPGFDATGALVVSSDGRTIEGIVSERDIVIGLGRMGSAVLSMPVRDLMTAKVLTCVPTDRVAGITALMITRHVQHLPVVRDAKLVGMVSVRDLLQLRLEEVLAEADAMQKYIGGSV